jgi:hypothetical protein
MSKLGININTMPVLHSAEALQARHIDVACFTEDETLGAGMQGFMVVKRTNQGERDQFIRKQMELTGSDAQTVIRSDVNTNRYYDGLIAGFDLGVDRLDPRHAERKRVLLQPTAAMVDGFENTILIGAANRIHRFDQELYERGEIDNPWFGRLHTIDQIPGTREALVTSASMDMIHVVNTGNGDTVAEFSMWDRFPCYNQQGQLVLREGVQPDFRITEPESNIVRVAPDGLGLHHSRLPLHINSAIMAEPGKILFTAFKTGTLYEYDLNSGHLKAVIEGMGAPHLIQRTKDGFMVTDTIGESVLSLRPDYSIRDAHHFSALGGKKPGLEAERWLQSAMPIHNGIFAAVDSPRSSLHLIDANRQVRRSIPFDRDWAVQTYLPLNRYSL